VLVGRCFGAAFDRRGMFYNSDASSCGTIARIDLGWV
jgi:hypothetical protein